MKMNVMKFEKYGTHIGVVKTKEVLIHNAQDFMDFLFQAMEEADATNIILEKAGLPEEFFDLKTGLAGEINQKLVNYRANLAVVGDFSKYDSKALADYIRESNKTGDIVFLRSVNEAISYFAD